MNSKAFIVFMIVTSLVSVGIVLFFAKRHPNPRFRPRRGEVFLLSLLMGFVSVGFSFFMSQLFEHDWEFKKTHDALNAPTGGSGGEQSSDRDRGGSSKDSGGGESRPPFLKDE